MSGTEHLLVEQVGHTLVITMNRPEAKMPSVRQCLLG